MQKKPGTIEKETQLPAEADFSFSGFKNDNRLRRLGDVNFYVSSLQYGFVEIAHLALCHAILDLDMGWSAQHPNKKLEPQGI